jgi:tripartite-type tricarboxylate transporter receptor subunit TctC
MFRKPGCPATRRSCITASSHRRGTPPAVIARLNSALNIALADTTVRSRLAVDGVETLPGTPKAYAADIASEQAKWSAIIKTTGVTAE